MIEMLIFAAGVALGWFARRYVERIDK